MPGGGARPAAGELLERTRELTGIHQALDDLGRGRGGVLVIEGAAGIGKSALLRVLCEQAADQKLQTLRARASELEREFGFGVVRQLLGAWMVHAGESERRRLLAGAAGLAAPVLGLVGVVGDSFATVRGLYWLVANLTASGPVVLAVDDLHWADEPSSRWLIYMCRRLEGLPVLIAATTRPPRSPPPQLLTELLAVDGIHVVRPRPLSHLAVAYLLCKALGATPDPVFVAACTKATGGNPFVLRELIADLAARGIRPDAAHAPALIERVPVQVDRVVFARLERLDHATVRLARAVAVLGEEAELHLAAALAELDDDTAAAAAEALQTAELLSECQPMRFVHPLVRTAIYTQIPPAARDQAHARAARLLLRDRADYERVAAQLLWSEPAGDPDAVQALRTAAATALARGAPETAINYLRRALREPPPDSIRAAVLAELGSANQSLMTVPLRGT